MSLMETKNGIMVHVDKEAGVVFCFSKKDLGFCKKCPTKNKKEGTIKDSNGEEVTIIRLEECPCSPLKARSRICISIEAKRALEEMGEWDTFLKESRTEE